MRIIRTNVFLISLIVSGCIEKKVYVEDLSESEVLESYVSLLEKIESNSTPISYDVLVSEIAISIPFANFISI